MKPAIREGIIAAVIIAALYLVFYAFGSMNDYQTVNCNSLAFNYSGQVSDFSLNASNESTLSVVYVGNTAKIPENVSLYAGTSNKTGITVEYPAAYVISPGREAYFQYLITPEEAGTYLLNLNLSARYDRCVKSVKIPIIVTVKG